MHSIDELAVVDVYRDTNRVDAVKSLEGWQSLKFDLHRDGRCCTHSQGPGLDNVTQPDTMPRCASIGHDHDQPSRAPHRHASALHLSQRLAATHARV